jgi:hypothetical protein
MQRDTSPGVSAFTKLTLVLFRALACAPGLRNHNAVFLRLLPLVQLLKRRRRNFPSVYRLHRHLRHDLRLGHPSLLLRLNHVQ